jgi:hypothetical protein
LLGILIFKGLTARRLYKSFRVKGLIKLRKKTVEGTEGAKFLPKELKFLRSDFASVLLIPTADSTHITLFPAKIY